MPGTILYVAVFRSRQFPDDTTKYHWALVPFRADKGDSFNRKVQLYQVIAKEGSNETDWGAFHVRSNLFDHDPPCYGCVKIGTVKLTKNEIGERLKSASPSQDGTEILTTIARQGRGWSCAQWILRVLQDWCSEGLTTLNPLDSDVLYNRVCQLGAALRHIDEDPEADIAVTVDGHTQEAEAVNGLQTLNGGF